MHTRDTLQAAVDGLAKEHGDWSYDIPLPFDVWTRGNEGIPHARLRRLVQVATDLMGGSLEGRRVLDLGCLEGLFAMEFAKQGAEAVGVEIRAGHIAKANLCKEALDLQKVSFVQDDVRNISVEKYGKFDVIVCSGILYHLAQAEVFDLVSKMHEMATRLVLIDTHIAIEPQQAAQYKGVEYRGSTYREHAEGSSASDRAKRGWASWDNSTSFWLTRPSLVNLMLDCGFSSVFECLMSPPHESDRGNQSGDRCTFAAVKGTKAQIQLNPAANADTLRWKEGALSYGAQPRLGELLRSIERRGGRAVKRLLRSR
jgi:SAM-dependent methyltransferase